MLEFKKVSLADKETLERYLFEYGENSCQHSFTAMYCMASKYGDAVCVKNGWLYVLRSGLCTERERFYLIPMGETADEDAFRAAVEEILDDAQARGCAARFETVTKRTAERLGALFPGRFCFEPRRDMFEYVYTHDRLALLPGHEMASKRHDIQTFFRDYGERTQVRRIEISDLPALRAFQAEWLADRVLTDPDPQLEHENQAIQKGFDHYAELGLSGIVLTVDGEVKGYAYGAPLSCEAYDVLIEKGDRRMADVYKVLNRDLVCLCCEGYRYINREEDVGVEGLRTAKMSYKPDMMIEKYTVREAKPN